MSATPETSATPENPPTSDTTGTLAGESATPQRDPLTTIGSVFSQAWKTLNARMVELVLFWMVWLASLVAAFQVPVPEGFAMYVLFTGAPAWFAIAFVFVARNQPGVNKEHFIKQRFLARLPHLLLISIIGMSFIFVDMLLTAMASSYIKFLSGDLIQGVYLYYAIGLNALFTVSMCFLIIVMAYAAWLVSLQRMNGVKAYFLAMVGAIKSLFKVFALMLAVATLGLIAASPIWLESLLGDMPLVEISAAVGGGLVSLYAMLLLYFSAELFFPARDVSESGESSEI